MTHSFEKVGDHWEPKDTKWPSDPRARASGRRATARGPGGAGEAWKLPDTPIDVEAQPDR